MAPKGTIFETLKPFCIKILNNGNHTDVKDLYKELSVIKLSKDVDCNTFSNLIQYVAFPLIIKLKNLQKQKKIHNEEIEEIIKCLSLLLKNSSNLDWLFFKDIFFETLLLFCSNPESQKVNTLSEECLVELMEIVSYLCNGLSSKDVMQYLSPEFKMQLGHAVSVCLQIVETEKHIALRLSALRAVRALGLASHHDITDEIRSLLATTFACFLPGIANKLGIVATVGEIQNHKVTVSAIQSWQYFVLLTLNDKVLMTLVPNFGICTPHPLLRNGPLAIISPSIEKKSSKHVSDEHSKHIPSVLIDRKWLSETKEHLYNIVKKFSILASHPHWEVRRTIGHFSFDLASGCVKSLDNVLVILLENLVILSEDSFPDVSVVASELINSLQTSFSTETKDDINNVIMDRILTFVKKLPTIARFQDDEHILNIIQQLKASFTIKSHLNETTLDAVYLDKILLSLATLLTFDCSQNELLQEHLCATDNIQILSLKPGLIRTFKYFRNTKIFNCVCNICDVICRSFSFMAITDSCIDLIQSNSMRRSEGYLLLMLFIEGTAKLKNYDDQQVEASVMSIIDITIHLQIFNVSISPLNEQPSKNSHLRAINNKDSSISVENARSNVIMLSYALQVVGKCSLLLKKNFTQFLNVILYNLLEKAGEINNVVSNSAVFALEDISQACGFNCLSTFIESSVPYFWYNLSLRLKKIPEYPSAPQVLRFTLVSHKIEMNAYIEELVEDILDSLDVYHVEMAVPLITVLLTYTESLNNNSDKLFSQGNNNFLVPKEEKQFNVDDVVDSIVKHVENDKRMDDALSDRDFKKEPLTEEDFKYEQEISEESEIEEEMIPKHISILESILERISYLLSVKDRKMQLLCLQIIQSSLDVLHKWENKKLPLFHKLWKPLVSCIKGKDLVVMLKSIDLSISMLMSSDDFLVSRYYKEIFPQLIDILSSQTSSSLGKTRKSGFYLSPGYKLQVFLLEKLPILVKSLDLGVKDCKSIMKVIFRYVAINQPYELVKLGVRCLEYLVEHNKSLSWYLLTKTRGTSVMTPSSDKFNIIEVHGRKIQDFHGEVEKIFKKLNIK